MELADAVDVLQQHANELGDDHGAAVAIRVVLEALEDVPDLEELGEMSDQLDTAQRAVNQLRKLALEAHRGGGSLWASIILLVIDGQVPEDDVDDEAD